MMGMSLNRRLVLEERLETADGAGGLTQGWVALGTLWAAMDSRSGREVNRGAVRLSRAVYRVTVRAAAPGAPSRPRPDQRFREGTRVYRILAVSEHDPQARYLTCFVEEEVAS